MKKIFSITVCGIICFVFLAFCSAKAKAQVGQNSPGAMGAGANTGTGASDPYANLTGNPAGPLSIPGTPAGTPGTPTPGPGNPATPVDFGGGGSSATNGGMNAGLPGNVPGPDSRAPYGNGTRGGGRQGMPNPNANPNVNSNPAGQPNRNGHTPDNVTGQPLGATRQVPLAMRSKVETDHLFYDLQLGSDPVDPNTIISGKPLTLAELLDNVNAPQTRRLLLSTYWELTGEIAKYKIINFRRNMISGILAKSGQAGIDTTLFQAAEKLALAQSRAAELSVQKKQMLLASQMKQYAGKGDVVVASQAGRNLLPIPCDFPLTVPYNTDINQLVRFRQVSEKTAMLNQAIPIQYQLIAAKNDAAAAAEELVQYFSTSMKQEHLVLAMNQNSMIRCELVDAVVEYNRLIADYVNQTNGPEIQGRKLLTRLIRLNPSDTERIASEGKAP